MGLPMATILFSLSSKTYAKPCFPPTCSAGWIHPFHPGRQDSRKPHDGTLSTGLSYPWDRDRKWKEYGWTKLHPLHPWNVATPPISIGKPHILPYLYRTLFYSQKHSRQSRCICTSDGEDAILRKKNLLPHPLLDSTDGFFLFLVLAGGDNHKACQEQYDMFGFHWFTF